MSQLFDSLEQDYIANGRRSLDTLRFKLAPLREAFGDRRAVDVKAADVRRYQRERLKDHTVASVNRELAAVRRSFKLGMAEELISAAPHIGLLAEHNVREGLVTPGEFEKIVAALPDHLKDVARFGYLTGRRRREVTSPEGSNVDLEGQRFTLPRRRSKNGQPRTVPIATRVGPFVTSVKDEREHVRQRESWPRVS
jgi:integrase